VYVVLGNGLSKIIEWEATRLGTSGPKRYPVSSLHASDQIGMILVMVFPNAVVYKPWPLFNIANE
jgi:hypothetical protein